jgi:pyridoxamine 5'-phosphate oxidase family protein
MTLTQAEIAYIRTQPLGRLATVDAKGAPQNSPVGFTYDDATGTIDIGGMAMGASRKFRNVAATGKVSFVVDDIASFDPWTVRMVEIRGTAEALTGVQQDSGSSTSSEIIRIHPTRVISFGLDPVGPEPSA